jgi:FkbM family methyltransferase
VERELSIFGRTVSIVDHDESHYLAGVSKDYELDTLSVFAAFCEPHFNALDVGANIGLTAIALGRLCSKGKVFAIEATPEVFGYLRANVARARLANVACENMAASSTAGQLTITFVPSASTGGFISQKYPLKGDGYRHCAVPARPLDEYIKTTGVDRIDFMKIDVEGFELEVLRGARQTIERCKPVIYCEVNHWCLNVFRRISLPDFIEEVFTFCPHVLAVGSDLQYLDLSDADSLHRFYHDHTTKMAFMNLVCGFDKSALVAKLDRAASCYHIECARGALSQECELERSGLRSQRDGLLNFRSWRHAAILRRLWALRRYVRRAA